MPRPEATTPTLSIVPMLRSVPVWFESSREALKMELGANAPHGARAGALAVELEEAEQAWIRERKEGQDVTLRRDAWVERVRALGGAVKATLMRRLDKHAERARLLQAFQIGAPSRLRTTLESKRFLSALRGQIEAQRALLDALGEPISAAWLAAIQELSAQVVGLEEDQEREQQERDQAKALRDARKAEAVALLRDLDLASQAVAWVDPKPARSLSVLFDTFNPTGPTPSEEDGELSDPTL